MNSTSSLQVVHVTDAGMFTPTLISLWSLLRATSWPVTAHVWISEPRPEQERALAMLAEVCPHARIMPEALDPAVLREGRAISRHITAATLGRLTIPARLEGRVLYLDGDTLVEGDVAPLVGADLAGQPLGAVRDYVVTEWSARRRLNEPRRSARVAELASICGPENISRYFNSGVLIFDLDALKASPAVAAAVGDIERASHFTLGDQDHLNAVFAGRVRLLDPRWNASWGRQARQRARIEGLDPDPLETAGGETAILHFHGPRKPWQRHPWTPFSARSRVAARYRRAAHDFAASFPQLTCGIVV